MFCKKFSHETHSNLFSLLRSSVPTSSRLSRDKYLYKNLYFFVLFHAIIVKFCLHVNDLLRTKFCKKLNVPYCAKLDFGEI